MAIQAITKTDRRGAGEAVFTADNVDELREKLAATVLAIDPYQSPSASPISVTDDNKFRATVRWYGLGD